MCRSKHSCVLFIYLLSFLTLDFRLQLLGGGATPLTSCHNMLLVIPKEFKLTNKSIFRTMRNTSHKIIQLAGETEAI